MDSTYEKMIGPRKKGMSALNSVAGKNPVDLRSTPETGVIELPDSGRKPFQGRSQAFDRLGGTKYEDGVK